jgi:hypothetical protein
MDDWKTKTFIFGGIIGLAAGIVASLVVVQQAEKHQSKPALSTTDGIKLGLGLLTFLRLMSDIVVKD